MADERNLTLDRMDALPKRLADVSEDARVIREEPVEQFSRARRQTGRASTANAQPQKKSP